MKAFMIAWAVFCCLVVAGLFIAYATDNFPGVPSPQQVRLEAAGDCSPCEENLKRLKAAMERWERERKAQTVVTTSNADNSP